MPLPRRTFLAGSGALCTTGLIAAPTRAEVPIGRGTLITLSDGYLELPKSFTLGNLPPDLADPILARHGLTGKTLKAPCNITLYRDDDRVVLFDAGAGTEFLATAGTLPDSLETAGISPSDITDVVITHGHPDHIWGLLDDFDDPAFPNARFHMGRIEWDYWLNPATLDEIGEARQSFAVGAKRRLETIEDRVALFDDGAEVLPGIAALATFGHTPGHMAFEVGATDPVFVVGDAIGNAHISMANPAWKLGSDQDPARAAESRQRLVDQLVANKYRLAGFHLPGGGIGRIETANHGYRFVGDTL